MSTAEIRQSLFHGHLNQTERGLYWFLLDLMGPKSEAHKRDTESNCVCGDEPCTSIGCVSLRCALRSMRSWGIQVGTSYGLDKMQALSPSTPAWRRTRSEDRWTWIKYSKIHSKKKSFFLHSHNSDFYVKRYKVVREKKIRIVRKSQLPFSFFIQWRKQISIEYTVKCLIHHKKN